MDDEAVSSTMEKFLSRPTGCGFPRRYRAPARAVCGRDSRVEGSGRAPESTRRYAPKIIDRRVDQRDDQHFLLRLELTARNDLRGERRERVRFARTGHSRNAKRAACIFQDVALRRTRSERECRYLNHTKE